MSDEVLSKIEELMALLPADQAAILIEKKKDLLESHKSKRKIEAIAEVLDIAKKNNFKITVNVDEKYKAPSAWNRETGQTAHGNGQKIKWLSEALKAGKTLDDFAVKD